MHFILGICGGSGAEKNYVAKKLQDLETIKVIILTQDSFYKGLPTGVDSSTYDFDHPSALSWDLLIQAFKLLQKGCVLLIKSVYEIITNTVTLLNPLMIPLLHQPNE